MKIKKLTTDAIIPTKAHDGDLGYDLYVNENCTLAPGEFLLISTGIAVEFPNGIGGIIKDRSSAALNGLVTHAGVIDNGYRGEIKIMAHNINSNSTIFIGKGQKIAQLVLTDIVDVYVQEVQELAETERGEKGFGSSGL